MSNKIQAIKIHLNKQVSQRFDLGIYTDINGSYLRWCEAPLLGVSDRWTHGVLYSISSFSKRGSFKTGGGSVSADGFTVKIFNNNQLSLKLDELGIYLPGCVCEALEFVGVDDDSDSVEVSNIRSGVIQDVTAWNSLTMTFEVKTSCDKRRANLGMTNDGKTVYPVIFGSSDPDNGRFFKLEKTKSIDTVMIMRDLSKNKNTHEDIYSYPPSMSHFPVCATSANLLSVRIRIGKFLNDIPPDPVNELDPNMFIGKYAVFSEGSSDLAGSIRKITGATFSVEYSYPGLSPFYSELSVTLSFSDYLPVLPVGNYVGTLNDNAWLDICQKDIEYSYDNAPVDGFYRGVDNVKLVNTAEVYGIVNNEVKQIASYLCGIVNSGNKLLINPHIFDESITNIVSIQAIPCAVSRYTDSHSNSVVALGVEAEYQQLYYGGSKVLGVYSISGAIALAESSWLNSGYAYDRLSTTYASFNLSVGIGALTDCNYVTILKVTLPKLTSQYKFKKAYLGLRMSATMNIQELSLNSSKFVVKKRGYINKLVTLFEKQNVGIAYPLGNGTYIVENLPDFYFDDNVNTGNRAFFEISSTDRTAKGRKLFDLAVQDINELNNIEDITIIIYKNINAAGAERTLTESIKIYDVAVVLEDTIDLSNEVYV